MVIAPAPGTTSGRSGTDCLPWNAGRNQENCGRSICKSEVHLTPNPILKVLSTLSRSGVRYLLMGGQACVLYGGAEFSRDTDVVLLAEPENLGRLRHALEELQAECIAVPPFEADYLQRGHAVHFRCRQPDAAGMRLDVMAVMRGVAPFDELWQRRTTLEDPSGVRIEAIASTPAPVPTPAGHAARSSPWRASRPRAARPSGGPRRPPPPPFPKRPCRPL
jgi:hypothetical protein